MNQGTKAVDTVCCQPLGFNPLLYSSAGQRTTDQEHGRTRATNHQSKKC